jgi:hypothetical protein
MKETARLILVTLLVTWVVAASRPIAAAPAVAPAPAGAATQIRLQPSSPPTVTAESEGWYQAGGPIAFAGNMYYPAGPAIHFLPNEMVPSGSYRGIPLYSRTTIEPYSIVFVPLAGGLMQPYERRRTGDLVGTTGSSVPSLGVEIPSAFGTPPPIQAAAPPFVETQPVLQPTDQGYTQYSADLSASRTDIDVEPLVKMSGASKNIKHVRSDRAISNGIFVEFDHARWYPAAPPTALDVGNLRRIGDWHGFPVYTARNGGNSTIYIPVAQGMDAYAAYSRRKN